MLRDERLEEFLSEDGIEWDIVSPRRHRKFCKEWEAIYGPAFDQGQRIRQKKGPRALAEYQIEFAPVFLIVPFLGDRAGGHSISARIQRSAAYECKSGGQLPDLTSFAKLDFFVTPPGMEWSLIHTHEDLGYGGPHFVRKEWLVPPTRGQTV